MNTQSWDLLPCGCQIGNTIIQGENVFVTRPCSLECKYYLYIIKRIKEQDKPLIYKIEK